MHLDLTSLFVGVKELLLARCARGESSGLIVAYLDDTKDDAEVWDNIRDRFFVTISSDFFIDVLPGNKAVPEGTPAEVLLIPSRTIQRFLNNSSTLYSLPLRGKSCAVAWSQNINFSFEDVYSQTSLAQETPYAPRKDAEAETDGLWQYEYAVFAVDEMAVVDGVPVDLRLNPSPAKVTATANIGKNMPTQSPLHVEFID